MPSSLLQLTFYLQRTAFFISIVFSSISGTSVAGEERRHNIRNGPDVHVYSRARPEACLRARGRCHATGHGDRLAPRRTQTTRQHTPIAYGLQARTRRPAVINYSVATQKLCYCDPKNPSPNDAKDILVSDLKTICNCIISIVPNLWPVTRRGGNIFEEVF